MYNMKFLIIVLLLLNSSYGLSSEDAGPQVNFTADIESIDEIVAISNGDPIVGLDSVTGTQVQITLYSNKGRTQNLISPIVSYLLESDEHKTRTAAGVNLTRLSVTIIVTKSLDDPLNVFYDDSTYRQEVTLKAIYKGVDGDDVEFVVYNDITYTVYDPIVMAEINGK